MYKLSQDEVHISRQNRCSSSTWRPRRGVGALVLPELQTARLRNEPPNRKCQFKDANLRPAPQPETGTQQRYKTNNEWLNNVQNVLGTLTIYICAKNSKTISMCRIINVSKLYCFSAYMSGSSSPSTSSATTIYQLSSLPPPSTLSDASIDTDLLKPPGEHRGTCYMLQFVAVTSAAADLCPSCDCYQELVPRPCWQMGSEHCEQWEQAGQMPGSCWWRCCAVFSVSCAGNCVLMIDANWLSWREMCGGWRQLGGISPGHRTNTRPHQPSLTNHTLYC